MKVCHILFCFIFLTAQQDGNSGRVNAKTSSYRRVEGEDVTFKCNFKIRGSRKFFCRGECENGNILIETTDDTFESGRYSMKYVRNGFLKGDIMYVSITQLKTSDSGWYRCSLDKTVIPDYFELTVTEASTPNFTLKPASTSTFLQSASTTTTTTTTTTTQSLNFSSRGSTPSSSSTEVRKHSETPAGPGAGELFYVIPVLVVMITLLSAALLIFYKKKRTTPPKGPPVEAEYADIMQTSQLCEDTRGGDRLSSSPTVAVSSSYTYPNSCQRNTAENLELYSLATCPQNKAEDDVTEVDYAEVDFSHLPATNGAPCGKAAEVIYSTPPMNGSHVTDVSPPLYSTVRKQ